MFQCLQFQRQVRWTFKMISTISCTSLLYSVWSKCYNFYHDTNTLISAPTQQQTGALNAFHNTHSLVINDCRTMIPHYHFFVTISTNYHHPQSCSLSYKFDIIIGNPITHIMRELSSITWISIVHTSDYARKMKISAKCDMHSHRSVWPVDVPMGFLVIDILWPT